MIKNVWADCNRCAIPIVKGDAIKGHKRRGKWYMIKGRMRTVKGTKGYYCPACWATLESNNF